jgi:hypothetical protein
MTICPKRRITLIKIMSCLLAYHEELGEADSGIL